MDERSNIVFEDRFTVTDVDRDGKKFDRVSRINAKSSDLGMELTLDVANELYPLKVDDHFSLSLARNSKPDEIEAEEDEETEGTRKIKRESWRADDQGLANDYDYVMYGKIYKFDDAQKGEAMTTAYMSFGGSLLALRGSYRHLANVVVGENVYLLMRK